MSHCVFFKFLIQVTAKQLEENDPRVSRSIRSTETLLNLQFFIMQASSMDFQNLSSEVYDRGSGLFWILQHLLIASESECCYCGHDSKPNHNCSKQNHCSCELAYIR